VEEICERAGFSRGAFYSNFDSRDELCLAALQRTGQESLRAMEAAVALLPQTPGGPDQIDRLVQHAVALFLQAQPKDLPAITAMAELRLHALRTPALRGPYLAQHGQLARSIRTVLEAALQRVGARLTIDIEEAIELLGAVYENEMILSALHGESRPEGSSGAQLIAVLTALLESDG
jgi:AcrR family transcriptional regulator